jgi:MYXO-CTERM domain-containing protein
VALKNYGAIFLDTPAMSHAAFGLLGLGILLVLLRRRATSDIVITFMLLSAFAFTLSFFVISIACDYRYLLFLDFSALAGAFHLAVSRRKSA